MCWESTALQPASVKQRAVVKVDPFPAYFKDNALVYWNGHVSIRHVRH
jgi:hypothetical protein